jgi:hypothetical protein
MQDMTVFYLRAKVPYRAFQATKHALSPVFSVLLALLVTLFVSIPASAQVYAGKPSVEPIPGEYHERVAPVDLAVTFASLAGVNQPSAAVGRVLMEAVRNARPAPTP